MEVDYLLSISCKNLRKTHTFIRVSQASYKDSTVKRVIGDTKSSILPNTYHPTFWKTVLIDEALSKELLGLDRSSPSNSSILKFEIFNKTENDLIGVAEANLKSIIEAGNLGKTCHLGVEDKQGKSGKITIAAIKDEKIGDMTVKLKGCNFKFKSLGYGRKCAYFVLSQGKKLLYESEKCRFTKLQKSASGLSFFGSSSSKSSTSQTKLTWNGFSINLAMFQYDQDVLINCYELKDNNRKSTWLGSCILNPRIISNYNEPAELILKNDDLGDDGIVGKLVIDDLQINRNFSRCGASLTSLPTSGRFNQIEPNLQRSVSQISSASNYSTFYPDESDKTTQIKTASGRSLTRTISIKTDSGPLNRSLQNRARVSANKQRSSRNDEIHNQPRKSPSVVLREGDARGRSRNIQIADYFSMVKIDDPAAADKLDLNIATAAANLESETASSDSDRTIGNEESEELNDNVNESEQSHDNNDDNDGYETILPLPKSISQTENVCAPTLTTRKYAETIRPLSFNTSKGFCKEESNTLKMPQLRKKFDQNGQPKSARQRPQTVLF